MDEIDLKILKEIQDGIDICEKPFEKVSEKTGVSVNEILNRLEVLKSEGVYGRFGASLNHRKLGFRANGMVVWNVDKDKVDQVGKEAAGLDEVTHCYRRPKVDGKWDYNIYTMIHAGSKDECLDLADRIAEKLGVEEYQVVFSTREFKKTGVQI